jgi:hypothetical protein
LKFQLLLSDKNVNDIYFSYSKGIQKKDYAIRQALKAKDHLKIADK